MLDKPKVMDFPPASFYYQRFHADDCLNNALGNLDVRMIEVGYINGVSPHPWENLGENCDPWFRLYYFPERSAFLHIEGNMRELKPGYLHLIPPRLKFRYDLEHTVSHLWLHFFSCELAQVLPMEVFSIPFDDKDLLKRIFECACTGHSENPETILESNLICRSLLNKFLLMPAFLEHAQRLGIPAPLQQAANYLNKNCCEKISMKDVASIVRLTPIQFKRLFFKFYRVNPKEYYCNARIDRAKELLMQTDLSTKEIAERCGFSSCYHFYHQFKKNTLLTPSQYRICNKIKR